MRSNQSQIKASWARFSASQRLVRDGAFLSALLSTLVAWLPLFVLPALAVGQRSQLPAWAFMWTMLFAIVAGCKWVTWCRAFPQLGRVGVGRSVAYLCAWPGMAALSFLNEQARPIATRPIEWAQAITKSLIGGLAVWGVASLVPADQPIVAGWIGLIGIALLLHFGMFHVLSLVWRSVGVDAPHIFRSPALARSVGDFWGSRWNLAFRDLAHRFVFHPLVGRLGVLGASLMTFAVSGFVHELVISVPAAAGYGLPTAYFLLQWLGVCAERSLLGRHLRLRRGFTGWLFALVVVAGPAWILFHPWFVTGVVVPFLFSIRAL